VHVNAAILCDFASVREGLLNVVGGGITRLWRPQLPAPMNLSVALMLELHYLELGKDHELAVVVVSEDGEQVIEVKGAFNPNGDLDVGENLLVPMALDLRAANLATYGSYNVEVSVDGTHHRTLPFQVRPPTGG
jgi:hypothetical protein